MRAAVLLALLAIGCAHAEPYDTSISLSGKSARRAAAGLPLIIFGSLGAVSGGIAGIVATESNHATQEALGPPAIAALGFSAAMVIVGGLLLHNSLELEDSAHAVSVTERVRAAAPTGARGADTEASRSRPKPSERARPERPTPPPVVVTSTTSRRPFLRSDFLGDEP